MAQNEELQRDRTIENQPLAHPSHTGGYQKQGMLLTWYQRLRNHLAADKTMYGKRMNAAMPQYV